MRDPKKLLIGMAIGNGTTRWETAMSLIALCNAQYPGWEIELYPGGGCDVCHARNLMFHYWRTRSTASLFGFIDSDVEFLFEQVGRVIQWFEKYPQIQYLGGLYPLKDLSKRWSYGGWSRVSELDAGLWEVFELCTGFTFLRYGLLERLIAAHPESAYEIEDMAFRGEQGYEICAMGAVTAEWVPGRVYSRRVPEDFYLSLRARALGVPIYVDPKIQLGHVGTINFKSLFVPGVRETADPHL